MPPCKGCKDRSFACWSKCNKYKDYRKRVDKANERRTKELCNKYQGLIDKYRSGGNLQ